MTCTERADTFPAKHPSATLDYAVNFEQECARLWEPYKDYSTSTRIRVYLPGDESGFELEATTGGRTAGRMPRRWPTVAGQTVVDGSVTWTVRALSSSSLRRTISGTPTWAADAGVTVSAQSLAGMVATANIAGGTDGTDYTITVTAAMSDGTSPVKTVILPVRIPVHVCEE